MEWKAWGQDGGKPGTFKLAAWEQDREGPRSCWWTARGQNRMRAGTLRHKAEPSGHRAGRPLKDWSKGKAGLGSSDVRRVLKMESPLEDGLRASGKGRAPFTVFLDIRRENRP